MNTLFNKRGISPIIAFVTIFALVVGIGIFVSTWYTQTSKQQAKSTLSQLEISQKCNDMTFDAGFDYQNCKLVFYNTGKFKIDKLKVDYYLGDGTTNTETIETPINPKSSLEINAMLNLKKMMLTPLIVSGEEEYSCSNEREFQPQEDLVGCTCGNDVCDTDNGENKDNCPQDCVVCGDSVCDTGYGETKANCAVDCVVCGDSVCDTSYGETKANCAVDCVVCGDSVCDTGYGEDCSTCIDDCACGKLQKCDAGTCVNSCGDSVCSSEYGETCNSCSSDCVCSKGEFCSTQFDQCVECEDKYDCSPTKPYCDSKTHTCVECLDNSNCGFAFEQCCAGECIPSTQKCIVKG